MESNILVIDDSLTVRTILKISLQRAGYVVHTFPDGVEALHALDKQDIPPPALLLLDVGLPKLDGYAVARAFKHHPDLERTIIILLSGHDHAWDKLRGRLAGAKGYLTKPFQPAQVLAVIQQHLAGQGGFLPTEAGRGAHQQRR
jgi:twitching motility two-component system response regulator PilG